MIAAAKRIGRPAFEPVTLDEAKNFLRVDSTDDDALITDMITVARSALEDKLGIVIVRGIFERVMDCFPDVRIIELWHNPVQSINHIKYIDGDGATQTFAAASYSLDNYREPARIQLGKDYSYPNTEDIVNAVKIRYYSGMVTPFTASVTDTITAVSHGLEDDDIITVNSLGTLPSALPTGLSSGVNYYIINKTANTFEISDTSGGTAVNITDTGTGTHYFNDIDERLRQFILRMIGKMYDCREDGGVYKLPTFADYLVAEFKVYAIG